MPDFTAAEIENIANSALDFHMKRGKVEAQTLQDKPLLKAMRGVETTFPGGKDYLTGAVKGEYTTTIQGFKNDDTVGYANPTNTKRYQYPWKLIHAGITFSMHELAKDGISVVDSMNGKSTSEHSEREMTMLANILNEKFEDLDEGYDRGFNSMYWADGSADPDKIPGITSFILDDPTSATVVGGIDQSSNTWWRNRANVAIDSSTSSNLNIVKTLKSEYRQLRRYGGNPKLWLAGSDFIEALEDELLTKGTYTQEGWSSRKDTEIGMAEIAYKGNVIAYDPTLDDLGKSKYLYVLDTRFIMPKAIEGEKDKAHSPARPENKYVFYRARTYMGGLVCNKRNAHGVYAIL